MWNCNKMIFIYLLCPVTLKSLKKKIFTANPETSLCNFEPKLGKNCPLVQKKIFRETLLDLSDIIYWSRAVMLNSLKKIFRADPKNSIKWKSLQTQTHTNRQIKDNKSFDLITNDFWELFFARTTVAKWALNKYQYFGISTCKSLGACIYTRILFLNGFPLTNFFLLPWEMPLLLWYLLWV